ncbi:MAG: glycosyltransferase family 2 protein [Oscillospiraceae bacterium]|nr:glycosyltransferase family 2 protein [Oscillospiraceae bacterium]
MGYKVSVVIPVYNAEKTLPRAVRSVVGQTVGFENIELLLCDDCSADGSWAMIQKLAKAHPNVVALRMEKSNRSAGAPRNEALRRATAPYVMFLDADDEFSPAAAALLLREMQTGKYDIVGGNFAVVPLDPRCAKQVILDTAPAEYRFPAADGRCLLVGHFCCMLYKTELIRSRQITFGSGIIAEDSMFLARYLLSCRTGKYIGDVVHIVHETANSASRTVDMRFYLDAAQAFKMIYALYDTPEKLGWLKGYPCATIYILTLSRDADRTPEEVETILAAWWPALRFNAENDVPTWAPVMRVMLRDAAQDDRAAALFHLAQFRALEAERAQQLSDIFGSTTWKAASWLQKLSFLKRAKR